jgi:hypothetical protein
MTGDEFVARALAAFLGGREINQVAALNLARADRTAADADREHAALMLEECACVRPRWSRDPHRCGACIGVLRAAWPAWGPVRPPDWLGDAGRHPRRARRAKIRRAGR